MKFVMKNSKIFKTIFKFVKKRREISRKIYSSIKGFAIDYNNSLLTIRGMVG